MPERDPLKRSDFNTAHGYGMRSYDCEMEVRKRRENRKKRTRSDSADSLDIPISESLRPHISGPWRQQPTTKRKMSQKEIKQSLCNVIDGEETESETSISESASDSEEHEVIVKGNGGPSRVSASLGKIIHKEAKPWEKKVTKKQAVGKPSTSSSSEIAKKVKRPIEIEDDPRKKVCPEKEKVGDKNETSLVAKSCGFNICIKPRCHPAETGKGKTG